MPVEADGTVWEALLNACKIHGNKEMFGQITRCLPTIEGVSIGTYALLSNTYASSKRWEDANVVRDVMRTIGLKKRARCSWIEADATIQMYDILDKYVTDAMKYYALFL
ncbi:putative pentatricopeptide repeat-containing protein [Camellia lanceoleosa]|uniref:Pentatricopeptide repeat-containing protein n=1 Tax=Camellia lanceoleosa TaxID=1840588 RepID=A0ACC0GMZ3_9ERIC|nr:putative pentatricopeptide repeat-containing protein [Camellia lanceoleosa]